MAIEIRLKDKVIPRNAKGDANFQTMGDEEGGLPGPDSVRGVFNDAEIVALVNRAIYQMEYQSESHKKRSQRERDRMKLLGARLKEQGLDIKDLEREAQLKGAVKP
jgi:hypothetical protein